MSKTRNFSLVFVFATVLLVAVDSNTPPPPQRITKLEGESVDLKCADIDKVKSRLWYFNTVDIRKLNPFAYRSLLSREGNIETLHIQDLRSSDTGVVQCRTVSPSGSSITVSYYLVIEYRAKVTFTTETTFFNVNYPTHLQCHVDAEPPVKFIAWTRNGSMFDPALLSADTEYFPEDGMIWFHKPKASDAGVYTCIPYNVHGSAGASKDMWLIVKERISTAAPKIDVPKSQHVVENSSSEYIEILPVSHESSSYSAGMTSVHLADGPANSISVEVSNEPSPISISSESSASSTKHDITSVVFSSDSSQNLTTTDSDSTSEKNETKTENNLTETVSISQSINYEQENEFSRTEQTIETSNSEETFTALISEKPITASSSKQTYISEQTDIDDTSSSQEADTIYSYGIYSLEQNDIDDTSSSQEADTTYSSEITDIITNSEQTDNTLNTTNGMPTSEKTETLYSTEQIGTTENSQPTDAPSSSETTTDSRTQQTETEHSSETTNEESSPQQTETEHSSETTNEESSPQQTETEHGSETTNEESSPQQTETEHSSETTNEESSPQQTETTHSSETPEIITEQTDTTVNSQQTYEASSSYKMETTFSSDSPTVSSSSSSRGATIISSEQTTVSDIISSTESIEIDKSEDNSYSGAKFIVSITLLVIAILSSIILGFYIIKTKRRVIAYDELRLLP